MHPCLYISVSYSTLRVSQHIGCLVGDETFYVAVNSVESSSNGESFSAATPCFVDDTFIIVCC
jgi:hypothetical protein